MLRAIAHNISPNISQCELTFVDRSPIDFDLAKGEHENYCAALGRLGVAVTVLSGNEFYPDCCFVEDTAIVVDELAVICSMGAASRRGETKLIEGELSKYRNMARVSLPATIDGGDVLTIGKKILVGLSGRTNAQAVEQLAQILRPFHYHVAPVNTKGSLHLKSACTAIDDETLFVNPDWVDLDELKNFKLIHTPPDEPVSAAREIRFVRQTTSIEISRATVHAAPPSIPYAPPVSQSGPALIACNRGAGASRLIPLTGRPRIDACIQFQDQCSPSGNHKLRVRR
jgi:dimethylargininase